jgi:hypothetical protein
MRPPFRSVRNGLFLLVFISGLACSGGLKEERLPETGSTLTGVVKYGDENLQFGLILVQTPTSSATGKIGDDGTYKVANVPIGPVKIGVNTSAGKGDFMSKSMAAGAYKGPEAKGKGKVVGLKFIEIPKKYFEPNTSGIETTIQSGSNTFDIVIPK